MENLKEKKVKQKKYLFCFHPGKYDRAMSGKWPKLTTMYIVSHFLFTLYYTTGSVVLQCNKKKLKNLNAQNTLNIERLKYKESHWHEHDKKLPKLNLYIYRGGCKLL